MELGGVICLSCILRGHQWCEVVVIDSHLWSRRSRWLHHVSAILFYLYTIHLSGWSRGSLEAHIIPRQPGSVASSFGFTSAHSSAIFQRLRFSLFRVFAGMDCGVSKHRRCIIHGGKCHFVVALEDLPSSSFCWKPGLLTERCPGNPVQRLSFLLVIKAK